MIRRVTVVHGDLVFINKLVLADLLQKAEALDLAVNLANPIRDLQFRRDECFRIRALPHHDYKHKAVPSHPKLVIGYQVVLFAIDAG